VEDRVLVQERRLQFSIVDEGIPLTGKTIAKPAKKSKSHKSASAPRKKARRFGNRGRRR